MKNMNTNNYVYNLQSCLLIPLGGVVQGLGLQTEPLNPLKPMPLGRALAREQESPTAACTFPQTSSPTLQGISMPLMGGMMGADGLTAQGVRSQVISILCFLPLSSCPAFYPSVNEKPFFVLRLKLITLSLRSGIHTRRSS